VEQLNRLPVTKRTSIQQLIRSGHIHLK
jgi:hypothetical protein